MIISSIRDTLIWLYHSQ